MSFLAGRLAGKEAAYFFEESKHVVARMVQKTPKTKTQINPNSNSNSDSDSLSQAEAADILPEVLRHSLPPKIFRSDPLSDSSLSTSAKWDIRNTSNAPLSSSVSSDVLNPLRAHLSLPQLTFGPKRWQLPTPESSVTASTANDLRFEYHTQVNPEKVRAAAEGLAHIGKAFAIATAIIFGSAALTFGFAASKLDIYTSDDLRTKGKDLVQPKLETIKQHVSPLRDWAENTSKKLHLKNKQDIKERPIIKELSKLLRAKDSA
ncbi:hypothetical protein BVRB_4g091070 [Beta vulgaris subsp. vulgaris]|uniref:Uncharacterized protein n=1 Tax=Beta vulgaris subsp. vulgaris TaxID=3555 RepID=A0A0J8CKT3_BETVV|nr:hypothetical protein BVRB_4g091070 [Beta vulgaris subsp. vulgaris]